MVELPSKPHRGSCSNVGKLSYSLIWVLPRKLGEGVYPSSHMYSSLYFVIAVLGLMMRRFGKLTRLGCKTALGDLTCQRCKHLLCQLVHCRARREPGRGPHRSARRVDHADHATLSAIGCCAAQRKAGIRASVPN